MKNIFAIYFTSVFDRSKRYIIKLMNSRGKFYCQLLQTSNLKSSHNQI